MVRDEADVIECFVRHSLAWIDVMHLVVHRSMDETPAILRLLALEGLPVEITVSEDAVFRQGEVQTRLARAAFARGADHVFLLDADEFLLAPDRERLHSKLAGLHDGTGAVAWRTYIPLPEDDANEPNVLRRITHRPVQERKVLGKVILGKSFARDQSLCLLEGSHWMYQRAGTDFTPLPMEVFADMWLAHFPVRSVGQAVSKVLQRRWQRRIAWVDEPIAKLVASGWRSTFERMAEAVLAQGTLTAEELAWFAYDYSGAFDPGPFPTLDSFRGLLVQEPCGDRSWDLHYAARIGDPAAALLRWVDGLIA
jgi:hypothetical protein